MRCRITLNEFLFVGLAAVGGTIPGARAQRLGIAVSPYDSTTVHQMAFYKINRTLYLANMGRHTIVQVSEISTAPLTPLTGAPWSYSIVAGQDITVGPLAPCEVSSAAATFYSPTGIAGWPRYAVGPTTVIATVGEAAMWVGLWVADYSNHAVRFIHFGRGNNVTVAAGSTAGARDGIGIAASLSGPQNLALGRFLRSAALERNDAFPGWWTTVVYFTDATNHCIRQGIPLRNTTHEFFNLSTTAADLADMVLNISTFVGLCDTSIGGGSSVGPVVPWSRMLYQPWGIALVALRVGVNTTTDKISRSSMNPTAAASMIVVGDSNNNRVVMIFPLYPSTARILTSIYADNNHAVYPSGVTVGRVRSDSTIEIFVGTLTAPNFLNITITFNVSTLRVSTREVSVLAVANNMSRTYNTATARYTLPNGTTNCTLVVFSGNSANGSALQFYCCLDAAYSEPIDLGGPLAIMSPGSRTITLTGATTSITLKKVSKTSRVNHTRPFAATVGRRSSTLVQPWRRTVTSWSLTHRRSRARSAVMSPLVVAVTRGGWTATVTHRPAEPRPSAAATTLRPTLNVTGNASSPSNATFLHAPPPPTDEDTFSITVRTQVVASLTSTAALGTGVAGFSTARSLGVLSVAQRCYYLLFHGDAASLDAANTTAVNTSVRLEFPDSAWPGLRIGDDAVAYERGAVVAGVVAVLATTVVAVVAVTALVAVLGRGTAAQIAVRLPMMAVVAVATLLSDGVIGGAALVGGVFTLVGLVVPILIIALVAVAGLRRVAHFDARYLETTAPAHQMEALRAARKGVFGTVFVAFVGVGAWRPPTGAAPKVTLWGLSAPAALTGRYRGPGGDGSEQGAVERVCVYYLALDVALAAALSLCRGLLVSVSCVAAAGAMAAVCVVSVIALVGLRPMTALAKNVVAVLLATGSATASLVLLVGVAMASRSIVAMAIRVSQWVLTASTAAAVVTVLEPPASGIKAPTAVPNPLDHGQRTRPRRWHGSVL